jgi:predicted esterase
MDAQFHTRGLVDGLAEVGFSFVLDGERVPGTLFASADLDEAAPLVLIQHPGMGSSDDYFVREPSMLWARRGWICAGLDAPFHGARDVHDPMRLMRNRDEMPERVLQFGREVSAALDVIAGRYAVDTARIGYAGYSLGAMLGVPAVARDGRFRAAAFCLVGEGGGMVGPATGPESVVPKLAAVAIRIVAKTADELIPRERTQALYDALPGEKDIVWLPGGHFEIGSDVIDAAGSWLAARFAAG